MTSIYQIQLYGGNPDSINSKAIISLSKINHILPHKWYLGKTGYPYGFINGSRIPLHKYIWYLNTGNFNNNFIDSNNNIQKMYIDHINRNKLDATDQNLRLSTPAQNSYNKTIRITKNTIIDPMTGSPLHHIKLKKDGYEVCINKDKQINKINNIKSLDDAKQIYNMIATELFGEFANLY